MMVIIVLDLIPLSGDINTHIFEYENLLRYGKSIKWVILEFAIELSYLKNSVAAAAKKLDLTNCRLNK